RPRSASSDSRTSVCIRPGSVVAGHHGPRSSAHTATGPAAPIPTSAAIRASSERSSGRSKSCGGIGRRMHERTPATFIALGTIDSLGGSRTPSSPREAFSTLPDQVLHDLAVAHGLDPTRYPNRNSLIEAVASSPDAEVLLAEADRRRMEYRLERLRPRQLRELGERTTEQLRRASWSYAVLAAQGLLEPCNPEDPETVTARALLERARNVFFQGQLLDDAFLQDLVRAAEVAHGREADRVRDLLALTRDSIREAANLGASIALAEDAWKRGGDFL